MSITDQGDIYFYALWTSDCEPSYPNCTHWSATNTAPGAWSIDMATVAALQAQISSVKAAAVSYYDQSSINYQNFMGYRAAYLNCRKNKGAC